MPTIQSLIAQTVDLLNADDWSGAESLAREILARDPNEGNGLRFLGAAYLKQGKVEQAIETLERAARLYGHVAVVQFELGVAYGESQRPRAAYECYIRANRLDPTMHEACLNLSAVTEQMGMLEEAVAWGRKAIKLRPACGLSHYNLANALRELGQLDAAVAAYCDSHRLKPDHAKTRWNLAACQLLRGNFAEGWQFYESREEAGEVYFDHYKQPRWHGEPLSDKTILVHAEQGIGDEIQFASCFPDLIPRAGRCILVCERRLEKVFARSFPTAIVYGHARLKDRQPLAVKEPVDFQIPAGSLPLFLRPTLADFPRRKRFLIVDAGLEMSWRERLAALGPELKVGIAWRAGGKPSETLKRSLPLDHWTDLLRTPNVRFVNLQYGDVSGDLAAVQDELGVRISDWEEGDPLVDLDNFLAKVAALDMVISVDNSTVHMAGAIGTPVWAFLPTSPSWRWMLSGATSPWYTSLRLLRQRERGQWAPPVQEAVEMLRHLAIDSSIDWLEATNVSIQQGAVGGAELARRAEPTAALGVTRSGETSADDPADTRTDSELLAEARQHETAGDLNTAEATYRRVLKHSPRHIEALCGLGSVARRTGRLELAIRSFRRAVTADEGYPISRLHLADSLVDARRDEEALQEYRRALLLNPDMWPAHLQAGKAAVRLGKPKEALDHFQWAAELVPQNEEVQIVVGETLRQLCRIDDAIAHLQQAAQRQSNSAAIQAALGLAYVEDQRRSEAEQCLRQAVALDPRRIAAQISLANVLEAQDRPAEAAECYERALELEPRSTEIMLPLALLRRRQGQLDEAAELLRRLVAVCPTDAIAHNTLGVVLRETGLASAAVEAFDKAIELQRDFPDARLNRSLALLQAGRLAEGWREYEWRWHCTAADLTRATTAEQPAGRDPLAGRTILVQGEQSLVEEVLFASCYPDVVEQSASCTILCDPRVERLLRRSLPGAKVCAVPRGREGQWCSPVGRPIDLKLAAGSLPAMLRADMDAFPQRTRYLQADQQRLDQWRSRLATLPSGLKIGFAWRDIDDREPAGARRPKWESFRQLLQLGGVQWISLLDGQQAGADLAAARRDWAATVHHWPQADAAQDIDELAARTAAVDLVVAVGGLPAHLAGALGVAACVLAAPGDWRWLATDDGSTPWYSAVRLYRPVGGDWEVAVGQLRQEILKRLAVEADDKQTTRVSRPHWLQRAAEKSRQ